MPDAYLSASRVVVFLSAIVYWAGVYVQTRRIRRRIGRSPNVRPRGTKETLLWAGWLLVVMTWLSMPLTATTDASTPWVRIVPVLWNWPGFLLGILLTLVGYGGTLWCYAAMGSAWRMGVDRAEKTTLVQHGPYRLVRHPLYLFQVWMVAGAAALLPTPASLIALAMQVACTLVKAADEEMYLRTVHGEDYDDYVARSGRFFPRIFGARSS